MKKFVKVMNTNDDSGISTELIRIDDLIKIVKWFGETGTEIAFEFNDATRKRRMQWIYDCGTTYHRDIVFNEYEKELT